VLIWVILAVTREKLIQRTRYTNREKD